VFLAQHASRLELMIRGDSLYKSMSSYLARRIEHTRNIQLNINTTIRRMRGDGHLDGVEVLQESTGQARVIDTPAVFSFNRGGPANGVAGARDRARRQGVHSDGQERGAVTPLE
jgi:thioredoxin reductase